MKSTDVEKQENESKQKNEKNLLIDLSNEIKSTDKSWVRININTMYNF